MWQRWNSTSHIFEKSDDNGLHWSPLPLNAATINEGTIPLPSNVALKDQSNIFNQSQWITRSGTPSIFINDTGQAADQRVGRMTMAGGGIYLQCINDAVTAASGQLILTRAGHTIINGNYYELNRTTAMGNWIDVPYSAGMFDPAFTLTNYVHSSYTLIGKTLIWTFFFQGTVVSNPNLYIGIPGGITPSHQHSGTLGRFVTAGGYFQGWWLTYADNPNIYIYRTDVLNLSGSTEIQGVITMRIK